jgi:small membrane protein
MVIKILVTLFVIFAISRVALRYRDKSFGLFALIFWIALWLVVIFFVWLPSASTIVAKVIGVGRGVDVLTYFAIIILFYGAFRLYVKMEFLEHEITHLVRRLAIRDHNDPKIE